MCFMYYETFSLWSNLTKQVVGGDQTKADQHTFSMITAANAVWTATTAVTRLTTNA